MLSEPESSEPCVVIYGKIDFLFILYANLLEISKRALGMIGSVGLFWIIGTFHTANFDSEGINIGKFLSRTILIL